MIEWLKQIGPLNEAAVSESLAHWNGIAKPLHSLGLLETMVAQIAGIIGDARVPLHKKCVLVLCADNGVVAENVTQTDSSVTAIVAENFAKGQASVNAMARAAGADVIAVDVGMLTDVSHPALINKKIRSGTWNMAKGPAMTRAEAMRAVETGIALAGEMKARGYGIIATGEMGIGNTTTSSAIASVLLSEDVERVTGRGAGLSDDGLLRKISVIRRAIAVNQPDADDPMDVLAKLGGFDIAAMAGVFLGGAVHRVPVVIDGFISSVAALVAVRLCPQAKDYMLASHVSREPAGRMMLDALGLTPILHAEMSLGEGTGAVALFPLLDMALAVYNQNTTFTAINIETYCEFAGGDV